MRVTITYSGHVSETDVFALPEIGAPYWQDGHAARVRGVRAGPVPRIELEPDRERDRILCNALPDGFLVAAGRRSKDGIWQAEVVSPARHVVGWAQAPECDEAVEDAVAQVALHELATAGYHPERE